MPAAAFAVGAGEPETHQRHVATAGVHQGLQVGVGLMAAGFAPQTTTRT